MPISIRGSECVHSFLALCLIPLNMAYRHLMCVKKSDRVASLLFSIHSLSQSFKKNLHTFFAITEWKSVTRDRVLYREFFKVKFPGNIQILLLGR